MFNFFQSIVRLVAIVINFIGNAIKMVMLIITEIPRALAFLFSAVAVLPPFLLVFVLLFVSTIVIINLINKGS